MTELPSISGLLFTVGFCTIPYAAYLAYISYRNKYKVVESNDDGIFTECAKEDNIIVQDMKLNGIAQLMVNRDIAKKLTELYPHRYSYVLESDTDCDQQEMSSRTMIIMEHSILILRTISETAIMDIDIYIRYSGYILLLKLSTLDRIPELLQNPAFSYKADVNIEISFATAEVAIRTYALQSNDNYYAKNHNNGDPLPVEFIRIARPILNCLGITPDSISELVAEAAGCQPNSDFGREAMLILAMLLNRDSQIGWILPELFASRKLAGYCLNCL